MHSCTLKITNDHQSITKNKKKYYHFTHFIGVNSNFYGIHVNLSDY